MTTQNTEPENSDVNVTVVEQLPASETPATSEETEVASPAQEQVAQIQTPEPETPAFEKQVEEEAVRPFTDFIKDFSHNETEFGSLLQDSQLEPFSSIISGEEQAGSQFTPGWENTPFGESSLLEGTPFAPEGSSGDASAQLNAPVESTANTAEQSPEPAVLPEGEQLSTQEQQQPASEPASPTERPVSPLLRPASRIRLPRHGSLRQREEPAAAKAVQQDQSGESETPAPLAVEGTPQVETAPVELAPVETTPQEEQPRPARRYRFDRREPMVSNVPAPLAPVAPVQAHTEESKNTHVPSQVFPRTENGQAGERDELVAQQSKHSTGVAQPTEQPVPKQTLVQEPAAAKDTEAHKATPSTPAYEGRRRHGQERQRGKAQETPATPAPAVAAAPAAEVTSPVTAASQEQTPQVAPEDLPPLEYSELQAASSRRRRRRRSGSGSSAAAVTPTSTKSVTPDVPALAAQTPSNLSPVAGSQSVAIPDNAVPLPGQYGVVSGYTVSQMNHGSEGTGPFMGPEPSPARGSTISRAVRPIRSEVQRIPTYPSRQNEPASVNHLANVISKAIQGQTDRMVAELRRANQIPTSVSVSLPPFPSTERVGVFVDVANLLYSARTLRMTIDFGKLLDFLRGNRRLVRAHAYCPTSPQPGDDQMFLQAVKGLGYRITTKDYKTFSSGAKKADLDLDLCMDVVRLVEGKSVDCIVLVSGDSDFMPMLDYCSDHGVRVEVAAFDESMSATLRQSCDLFINLSMLDEIRA